MSEIENDAAPPADAEEKPFDASDPEEVQRRKSKAGRKRKAEVEVVKALMENRDGRAWLWSILEFCNIYGECFREGSADGTAFMLGQRNVGLRLVADMNRYPALMKTLLEERLDA